MSERVEDDALDASVCQGRLEGRVELPWPERVAPAENQVLIQGAAAELGQLKGHVVLQQDHEGFVVLGALDKRLFLGEIEIPQRNPISVPIRAPVVTASLISTCCIFQRDARAACRRRRYSSSVRNRMRPPPTGSTSVSLTGFTQLRGMRRRFWA